MSILLSYTNYSEWRGSTKESVHRTEQKKKKKKKKKKKTQKKTKKQKTKKQQHLFKLKLHSFYLSNHYMGRVERNSDFKKSPCRFSFIPGICSVLMHSVESGQIENCLPINQQLSDALSGCKLDLLKFYDKFGEEKVF